jgi:sugar phosphate isomerase/epimerase
MSSSRREFLAGAGAAGVMAAMSRSVRAASASCPFRLAVINDEISPDFDHACYVASHDFGLEWIELRSMWKINISDLKADDVTRSQKILAKYNLKVTDIGSPLYKVNWPGAPIPKASPQHDVFSASATFKQQDEVLERCIEMAKAFKTDRIRGFDFWRLDDPRPYRKDMNEVLRKAARKCAQHKLILLLENEMACNTGSGLEAVETLKAIQEPNFMLNWDPGNSATFPGDVPYPIDYDMLPKHRIGHCHCKDTIRLPNGKAEWAPVGGGIIDWVGQFKALVRDGYHYAVSLETHWHGGVPPAGSGMGIPEASTRTSMAGLKEALSKAGISC